MSPQDRNVLRLAKIEMSSLAVGLAQNPECAHREFLASNHLSPMDLDVSLDAYVAGDVVAIECPPDANGYAAQLYANLRAADEHQVEVVVVVPPLQGEVGTEHVHAPPLQTWPAGHALPQEPQLALEVIVLTQTPLQAVVGAVHERTHEPVLQSWLTPQTLPHEPQLLTSSRRFKQTPLQDEVGAAHAGDAQSLTDAWDGKVSWGDFLANAAGYVAGQALQSIATGGMGAIGARMLAKQGAKEAMEAAAAKAIAAGASKEAAEAASVKALAEYGGKAATRGAVAGAGAQNFGMELGSIYPDAVEQAEKDGRTLDAGDKFKVFAAASLAAGVDTAGEAIMASRVLKGSGAGGKGILGRALREVPSGMAREAGTEAIQTGIEQWGASKPLDVREIVDSAGVGAVGGGLGGAGASLRAREQGKKPGVPEILGAPGIDKSIEFSLEAVSAPAAKDDKPLGLATAGDGVPFEADPRFAGAPILRGGERTKTPTFGSKQQADIYIGEQALFQTHEAVEVAPGRWEVQPTAATRALMKPNTMLPVGEAGDLVPDETINADLALMKFRTPEQIAAEGMPRIPTGDATELEPIPTGEATEYDPPADMVPRRKTDGVPLDLSQSRAVAGYVERMRGINTPAARAFVQDYQAGRITDEDFYEIESCMSRSAGDTTDCSSENDAPAIASTAATRAVPPPPTIARPANVRESETPGRNATSVTLVRTFAAASSAVRWIRRARSRSGTRRSSPAAWAGRGSTSSCSTTSPSRTRLTRT